jgi:hypothetical protein
MSEPESQPFLKTAQSRRPLQIWVLGVDLDLARLGMLGLELDSPVRCSGSGWTWIRQCSGGAGFARGRRARAGAPRRRGDAGGDEGEGGPGGATGEGGPAPASRAWPRVTTADDRRRALGTGFLGMKGTKEEIMF